jgi:hypothetical protein
MNQEENEYDSEGEDRIVYEDYQNDSYNREKQLWSLNESCYQNSNVSFKKLRAIDKTKSHSTQLITETNAYDSSKNLQVGNLSKIIFAEDNQEK